MFLKIRFLTFILLLVMLFSGVVCGKNLLIGGIGENGPNPSDNPRYVEIANQLKDSSGNPAVYVPTYYHQLPDGKPDDIQNADEVRKAALGEKTDQNGLKADELNKRNYDTIIAYSGGTASALTALANQGVTCDTLILISPMRAGVPSDIANELVKYNNKENKNIGDDISAGINKQKAIDAAENNFNSQVNKILTEKTPGGKPIVKNIVVIQSPQDQLPNGDIYQYRFPEGANPKFAEGVNSKIEVHTINLDSKVDSNDGEQAHIDLFFTYAKGHLAVDNGKVAYSPTATSTAFTNPWSNPKFYQWGPKLSPPSSETTSSATSTTYNENSNAPNTAGNPQVGYVGNMYMWYWDVFTQGEWGFNNKNPDHPEVPPVPPYFKDGSVNKNGYDWVNLPYTKIGDWYYSQTGIRYSQNYLNMVKAYVASNGGFNGVAAGVGPL